MLDGISKFTTETRLIDKAANKIRDLPGGTTTLNALGKAYGTITSKPVLNTIKIVGAIALMPIVPIAGAVSLGSIAFNAVKETLEARNDHILDVEKKPRKY